VAPEPSDFIRTSEGPFESPFFHALGAYLKEHPRSAGFVQSILDISLLDAKAFRSELVSAAAKAPARQ